jgi:putative tricarboxylic transport membrane protein
VLAGILIAFGVFVLIRGLLSSEKVSGRWGWKALAFIVLALVAFGWTMDKFGFLPALVVMFFISAFGGHEFHFLEVLVLTIVMSIFAWVVFIWLLGLPYQLIQGIPGFGY